MVGVGTTTLTLNQTEMEAPLKARKHALSLIYQHIMFVKPMAQDFFIKLQLKIREHFTTCQDN